MRQRISSKLTIFHRYVGLVGLTVVFAGLAILLVPFFSRDGFLILIPFVGVAIGFGITLLLSLKIKVVDVDQDFLYVAEKQNRESKIPIVEIESIKQNRWMKPYPVTIRLRQNSRYGEKIVFIPTLRFGAGFSEHPIVEELSTLVRHKRLNMNF